MVDYYHVLGVKPSASTDELKNAFRRAAKACHPDANPHLKGAAREEANQRFVALAQAYDVLSDPAKRTAYDQKRAEATRSGPTPGAAKSGRAHPGASQSGFGGGAGHRPQSQSPSGDSFGSRTHTRRPNAEPGHRSPEMDELMRDVESRFNSFGLSTKQPWEKQLDDFFDAMLDWAKQIYQQVQAVLDEKPQANASQAKAQKPNQTQAPKKPQPTSQSHESHQSRPKEGPSQGASAASHSQTFRPAESDAQVKRRLRELSVEDELAKMKAHLQKTPPKT